MCSVQTFRKVIWQSRKKNSYENVGNIYTKMAENELYLPILIIFTFSWINTIKDAIKENYYYILVCM